jgi:hypothetical protein
MLNYRSMETTNMISTGLLDGFELQWRHGAVTVLTQTYICKLQTIFHVLNIDSPLFIGLDCIVNDPNH